ncbi:MAG: hypothetical protein U1F83_09175 [Verrucomicrobiota bacterium]
MKSSAFVKKYSVVFISRNGRASEPFYFFSCHDRTAPRPARCARSSTKSCSTMRGKKAHTSWKKPL